MIRWEKEESGAATAYVGSVWAGRIVSPNGATWAYKVDLRFVTSRRIAHTGLVRNRASAVAQVEKVIRRALDDMGLRPIPALNVARLVKAAKADLERQCGESDRDFFTFGNADDDPTYYGVDGRIDLEALVLAIATELLEPEAKR